MSGTKVLLDTNIVLYVLNGDEQVAELIQGCQAFISVITRVELFSSSKLSSSEEKAIQSFIDDCELVQSTPEIQEQTIEIRQRTKMKFPDAAIAASAAYMGIQLITADKSFTKVKDLISILIVER